jgi:hypothetical protein
VTITDQPEEIVTFAGVDPCPNRDQRWPTASHPSGFFVIPKGTEPPYVYTERWDPAPTAQLRVAGPKIILRVSYVGFPYFQTKAGTSMAEAPPSEIKLMVKVWATGTNP